MNILLINLLIIIMLESTHVFRLYVTRPKYSLRCCLTSFVIS